MSLSSNNCPVTSGNAVYLNKVFFKDSDASCPILLSLATGDYNFVREFTVSPISGGGGCCCCNMEINQCSSIEVTKSHVNINSFRFQDETAFTADSITVDGFPLTDITPVGEQFVADLSSVMSDITKCGCDKGHFILINAAGPWFINVTIVVEGIISGNGTSCRFKLCLKSTGEDPISLDEGARFASDNVLIPCKTAGISPSMVLGFNATANLLNPEVAPIIVEECQTLELTGTLVVTPEIDIEVTRPSLFRISGAEIQRPCDDVGQCNDCESIVLEDCDDNQAKPACSASVACQCCGTNGYRY